MYKIAKNKIFSTFVVIALIVGTMGAVATFTPLFDAQAAVTVVVDNWQSGSYSQQVSGGWMSALAGFTITGSASEQLQAIKVEFRDVNSSSSTPSAMLAAFEYPSPSTPTDNQGLCVYADTNGNGWFEPGNDLVVAWEAEPSWNDEGAGVYSATLDIANQALPASYAAGYNFFVHMKVKSDAPATKSFKISFPTDAIVTSGTSPTISSFETSDFFSMGGGDGAWVVGPQVSEVFFYSPKAIIVSFDVAMDPTTLTCSGTEDCGNKYTINTVYDGDSEGIASVVVVPNTSNQMIRINVSSDTILTSSYEDTLMITTDPVYAPRDNANSMPFMATYPLSPIMRDSSIKISEIKPAGAAVTTEDFIELYNAGSTEVDLTGYLVKTLSGTSEATLATIGAVALGVGEYYLLANSTSGYNESITADASYSTDISENSVIYVTNSSGSTQDLVGMGTAAAYEDAAFGGTISAGQSIERKALPTSTNVTMIASDASIGNAYDSDNNVYDFVVRAAPDPQISTGDAETPWGGGGYTNNIPTINHMPVVSVVTGQDLKIPAAIYDQEDSFGGLATAELCYITSNDVWGSVACVNGQMFSDVIFTVPASILTTAATGGGLEYYIHVVDGDSGEVFGCADPTAANAVACQTSPYHVNVSSTVGSRQISGTVYRSDCATAIPNATIYVEGAGLNALSAGNGTFSITGVPDGIFNLRAAAGGYVDGQIWGVSVNTNNSSSSGWQFCLEAGSAGQGGDSDGPNVVWTAPGEGMIGAPSTIGLTEAPIMINLDKAIDATTVTTSNVILRKFTGDGSTTVSGYSVGVDSGSGISGTSFGGTASSPNIVIYSATRLDVGYTYIAELTAAVKDNAGNAIEGNRPGGGSELMFSVSNVYMGGGFGFTENNDMWSGGDFTNMMADSGYQDMMGHYDADSGRWGGGAYNPPYIFGTVPSPGQWSVPINTSVMFEFSEAIDSSTVNVSNFKLYLVNADGSETDQTASKGASVALDSGKTIVTMSFSGSLDASSSYLIKVKNGVRSTSGITLGDPTTPGGIFYRSNFETAAVEDTTAPSITGSYPDNAATNVPLNFGFINIGYSEAITNVNSSTVKLKQGTTTVPTTVELDMLANSIKIFPSSGLMPGATYTIQLTNGGATGIQDSAGNPSAAGTTTRTFTMSTTAPTTQPSIEFCNCDDYTCAITFSQSMNAAKVTDTNRFTSSVLKKANYTITHGAAGDTAYTIPVDAKFSWDNENNTALIEGMVLTGNFNITAANITDLFSNPINTSADTCGGPVNDSSKTMGFMGPGGGGMMGMPMEGGMTGGPSGFGSFGAKEAGMMGAMVMPMNTMAGSTTTYFVDFPVSPSGSTGNALDDGSYIKLSFPRGFNVSSVIPDPYNPAATDLNWDGPSTVTLKTSAVTADSVAATQGGAANDGVTVSGQTVTVWLDTDSGTTGDPDFFHFEIKGIVNTSVPKDFDTDGYTVDMKSYTANGTLVESKTSMPFFIGAAGTNNITVNITAADAVGNLQLNMGSPMSGPMDSTVAMSGGTGTNSWTNLPNGCYHIFTEPTISLGSNRYSGQMNPEPICLPGSGANWNSGTSTYTMPLTFTKLGAGNSASLTVSITGTFAAGGESVDIWAGGPNSFTVETTTLTGAVAGQEVTLFLPSNGNYNVGMGPAMPKGPMMGPPPMPDWMPPMGVGITVSGVGGTPVIKNSQTGATITSVSLAINSANKQIIGRAISAQTTLSGAYSSGGATLALTSASGFAANDFIVIDDGTNVASGKISSISGTTVTLVNTISQAYSAGAKVFNVINGMELWANQPMGFGGMGSHTQSKADGSFVLKVAQNGTYEIGAFKPGMGEAPPISVTVKANNASTSDGNATADIKFMGDTVTSTSPLLVKMYKPAYTISGKISDSDGNALQYAHVMAKEATTNQMTHSSTDSTGSYILYVSAGTWTITADMPPGTNTCGTITKTVIVTDADKNSQNIQPASGTCYTISGTISIGGTAQANIPVMVEAWDIINDWPSSGYHRNENTDSSGAYSVKVGNGTYRVSVWTPDYGEISQTVVVDGANETANVSYDASALKTLTVSFTGGTSSMNGFIEAKTSDGGVRRGYPVTDLSESKTLSLPSGTYKVLVFVNGLGDFSPDSNVTLISDQTVTVDLSAQTLRTLSGTIKDDGGDVISGAAVIVLNTTTGLTKQTTTDSSGNYSMAIKEGTYTVKAEHKDYATPAKATVAITENLDYDFDEANTRSLEEKDKSITGVIYESDGSTPMTSGFVYATTSVGEKSKASIQSDGTYSLPVTDGTWTVKADGPLHAETTRSATVTVSDVSVSSKDITLTADANDTKASETRTVTPSIGATVNDQENTGISFTAGTNILGRDSNPGSLTFEEIDMPETDTVEPIGDFVDITAKDSNDNDINDLTGNGAEIVFSYTAADLSAAGVSDESRLTLTYYDETTDAYMPLDNQVVDTVNNTITGYIDHLTPVGITAPLSTASAPDRTSPGGGPPIVTVIEDIIIGEDATTAVTLKTTGTRVTLSRGGVMIYTLAADGEAHSLKIYSVDMTGGQAVLTVASEPQNVAINLGKTVNVDVNGDEVDDYSVKLEQLLSVNQVKLLITKLEAVPEVPEVPEITEEKVTKEEIKTVTKVVATDIVTLTNAVPSKAAKRDLNKELSAITAFYKLTGHNPASEQEWQIIDFLAYGSTSAIRALSERERQGLLEDYKAIYDRFPGADSHWLDLAKIAQGTTPSRVLSREVEAVKAFAQIFGRAVNFKNTAEEKFIHQTAYRLRTTERSMAKEAAAITRFRSAYRYSPKTGFMWSIIRALAYAGALEEQAAAPVPVSAPTSVAPPATATPIANAVPVLPKSRDLKAEINATGQYAKLMGRQPSDAGWQAVNFIAYGSTDASKTKTTDERYQLLKTYKNRYGKLPASEADWQKLAEMAK